MKPSILKARASARERQSQARTAEVRRVQSDMVARSWPEPEYEWGAAWKDCRHVVMRHSGPKCVGTGRQDSCQTCGLASLPWAYLGDDGYIHCPKCSARLLGKAVEDWPRGGNAACPSCGTEYIKP